MIRRAWVLAALSLLAAPAAAQPYAVARLGDDVIQLQDERHQTIVSILTSVGNIAYEMLVKGHNVLRFPFADVGAFRARPSGLHGIPLLAPWANRLDEPAFFANGVRYPFDSDLGNVSGATPIHGFLSRTEHWQVVELRADGESAWLTSRLDVYRHPAWMKQFPFAHTIEMTYRLADGVLEVDTTITNLAAEPMPVAIGFHPYFQLTDSGRADWTITVPARRRWLLSDRKLPTGETEPAETFFVNGRGALRDYDLDDVFSDLVRDAEGMATVVLKGRTQQLEISQGPRYRGLVIYSPNPEGTGRGSNRPAGRAAGPSARGVAVAPAANPLATPDFICIEPMAAVTNAMNLAHRGLYDELQSVPPGGTWREQFRIRPSGF